MIDEPKISSMYDHVINRMNDLNQLEKLTPEQECKRVHLVEIYKHSIANETPLLD